MSFNRIAIYGHRGWASSVITKALIASKAPVKILHRPASDISQLPDSIEKVEVDVEDTPQLINALKDVDILMYVPDLPSRGGSVYQRTFTDRCSSLVGQPAIASQFAMLKAIPHTQVKLFVPSELGSNLTPVQSKIGPLNSKDAVSRAAKKAGIPTTLIWPGSLVESTFATLYVSSAQSRYESDTDMATGS